MQNIGLALIQASLTGNAAIVSLLLAANDDDALTSHTYSGTNDTALVTAAENGHTEVVQILLAHGTVDRQNPDKALILAALNDHAAIVSLLLTNGANSSSFLGEIGNTALVAAAEEGHTEVVQVLLAHGTVDRQNSGQALIQAAHNDHAAIVSLLLANGADCSLFYGQIGLTALVAAAQFGHTGVVQILLAHGTVDKQNPGQALIRAAHEGHAEIVSLLLAVGADTGFTDDGNDTALVEATRKGQIEVVRILLAHGALERQKPGRALSRAIANNHPAIAQLLRNAAPGPAAEAGGQSALKAHDTVTHISNDAKYGGTGIIQEVKASGKVVVNWLNKQKGKNPKAHDPKELCPHKIVCPGSIFGHNKLDDFTTPKSGFGCDVCGREDLPVGTRMKGCRLCDWDVCEHCGFGSQI